MRLYGIIENKRERERERESKELPDATGYLKIGLYRAAVPIDSGPGISAPIY